MPGYVVHALAIAHYKKMGMKFYDLMHGDSLYKRMLCNRRETLRWVVMQRPRLKFDFENYVMNLTRITRNIMKTTVVIPAKAG